MTNKNSKYNVTNSVTFDKTQFDELIKKFETIEKLLALNILKNKKLKEQVETLHSLGIPISEISIIVNKKMTDIGQYIYRKPKKSTKKSNEE